MAKNALIGDLAFKCVGLSEEALRTLLVFATRFSQPEDGRVWHRYLATCEKQGIKEVAGQPQWLEKGPPVPSRRDVENLKSFFKTRRGLMVDVSIHALLDRESLQEKVEGGMNHYVEWRLTKSMLGADVIKDLSADYEFNPLDLLAFLKAEFTRVLNGEKSYVLSPQHSSRFFVDGGVVTVNCCGGEWYVGKHGVGTIPYYEGDIVFTPFWAGPF